MNRWLGLTELLLDAVHHGSIAVEKVHQSVARTPLDVLAKVPPLTASARWISAAQSELIARTYATIRETSAEVGVLVKAFSGVPSLPPVEGRTSAHAPHLGQEKAVALLPGGDAP